MKRTNRRIPALFLNINMHQFQLKNFRSLSLSFCLFQEFLVIIAFSLAVPHIISLYSFPLQRAMQMHPPLTLSIISNILLNTQTLSYFVHFWLQLYLRFYSSDSEYLGNNNPIQPSMHDINYFMPQHHCFGRERVQEHTRRTNKQTALVSVALCFQYN